MTSDLRHQGACTDVTIPSDATDKHMCLPVHFLDKAYAGWCTWGAATGVDGVDNAAINPPALKERTDVEDTQ